MARLAVDALICDQTVRIVAFAGGGIIGVGSSYIHAANITQGGRMHNIAIYENGTTKNSEKWEKINIKINQMVIIFVRLSRVMMGAKMRKYC